MGHQEGVPTQMLSAKSWQFTKDLFLPLWKQAGVLGLTKRLPNPYRGYCGDVPLVLDHTMLLSVKKPKGGNYLPQILNLAKQCKAR